MSSPKEIWQAMPEEERSRLSALLENWSAQVDSAIKKDITDAMSQHDVLRVMMQRWMDATPVLEGSFDTFTLGQYLVARARQREIALICLQNRPDSPEQDKSEE